MFLQVIGSWVDKLLQLSLLYVGAWNELLPDNVNPGPDCTMLSTKWASAKRMGMSSKNRLDLMPTAYAAARTFTTGAYAAPAPTYTVSSTKWARTPAKHMGMAPMDGISWPAMSTAHAAPRTFTTCSYAVPMYAMATKWKRVPAKKNRMYF